MENPPAQQCVGGFSIIFYIYFTLKEAHHEKWVPLNTAMSEWIIHYSVYGHWREE